MSMDSAYADAAREADLLRELHGRSYVAAVQGDPWSGRPQLLVEWCDPELLDEGKLSTLVDSAPAGVVSIMVRTPGTYLLGEPWRRHVTYVRYTGLDTPSPPAQIRPATVQDEARIVDWLAQAYRGAQQDQGVDAVDPVEAAQSDWEAPGRESVVCLIDGEPVGHATWVCGAIDEPTGRKYVDLLDTLVELEAARSATTRALVLAAARRARELNLPLIGNVVHPRSPAGQAQAEQVLAKLVDRDWVIDHCFWIREQ